MQPLLCFLNYDLFPKRKKRNCAEQSCKKRNSAIVSKMTSVNECANCYFYDNKYFALNLAPKFWE